VDTIPPDVGGIFTVFQWIVGIIGERVAARMPLDHLEDILTGIIMNHNETFLVDTDG